MFFGHCLLDIGHPTRVSLAQIMKIKTNPFKNCLYSAPIKNGVSPPVSLLSEMDRAALAKQAKRTFRKRFQPFGLSYWCPSDSGIHSKSLKIMGSGYDNQNVRQNKSKYKLIMTS